MKGEVYLHFWVGLSDEKAGVCLRLGYLSACGWV